ncbi:MAG TPA: type III secretion system cytoplasmic ring protein SctQ [Pyrinomonadaceae bacterium]|jgi:type III secretion protein Q
MKADATDKAGTEAPTVREGTEVGDPFAVDLFARGRHSAGAPAHVAAPDAMADLFADTDARAAWSIRLPRVSRAELRLSSALGASLPTLSAGVRATLVRVLSQYLREPEDEIVVSQADVREREFSSNSTSTGGTVDAWTTLALAPANASLFASLQTDFASALVDRMLGGEGHAPETLRLLSRTELAAFEFLWLCLIRELHRQVDAPLWRLEGVSTEPPASLKGGPGVQSNTRAPGNATKEQTGARAIVATFALRVGALSGLVSFYFTRDALAALEGLRHSPLFAGRERDARRELFKRVAPDVRLRPVLGETDVRAIDLADLESGDVVVVARPLGRFEAGRLSGRLEMCLGDGAGAILTGTLTMPDDDAAQLLIEQIKRGGELHGTERWDMEQEQTSDEDSNESAIALEEILLTVRVELAERRLSLDELARLRVGQLLPLGCQATDPVDLVADGRRVARGELVEIEGRLGVRVTQVLR